MQKHVTDQNPATPEQLAIFTGELALAVAKAKPSFVQMQRLLGNKVATRRMVTATLIALQLAPPLLVDDPHREQRALWEGYYSTCFGMTVNLSKAHVPTKPTTGKWRLLAIAEGLTMNHAAESYRMVIRANDRGWGLYQSPPNLDAAVTRNARTSTESYFVWVHDEDGPDSEYLGKSANDADPNLLIGVTLLERLVHGTIHLLETKKHLDEQGFTSCTGSRHADGDIPWVCVNLAGRQVCVGWYGAQRAFPRGGLRQAVS